VGPAGVDVEIDVDSSTPPAIVAPKSTRSSNPVVATKTLVARGPRWFSGGLHLHTLHSDGTVGPNALAASARAAGLDFVVITDHNNTTHTLEPVDSETPLRIVG